MREAGVDPAPDPAATTCPGFLRPQAEALLAADIIETVALTGAHMCILVPTEHATRLSETSGARTRAAMSYASMITSARNRNPGKRRASQAATGQDGIDGLAVKNAETLPTFNATEP